ncbi:hypothetical protein LCGC14_1670450 [marine sediment metagenome]|uniref:HTH cro/C1-type domain-containing protein n=1 Tax=marine sediment metagenome TaxID=412755 RepID=A0A0F9IE26_9ZZZZ
MSVTSYTTVGKRLRMWRKQKHTTTLRAAAVRTGLSVSFLSDIERDRTLPSLRTCQKLVDIYGKNMSMLFAGVRIEEDK